MRKQFRDSINTALNNPNLTGALGRFSEAYRVSREKAYEGIDFEAVRTQIAERKGYAASHLDELAERFTAKIEARGAKVFRTDDPAKVREYILNLARQNGVKTIVKSKSMASEEIHLNQHLEGAGIEVRETDLGEWIIQLAGQTPSHMVMPAIHMTKEEVADVFSDKVEQGQAPDIPKLVKFARGKLRDKFLSAGMGITGANIAVAETGTLVIITNEGNARLVTTLPKIHVAIVGIEKLMSDFADVVPVLTALPRSATAQLLTSYVTMISGPVPNTDGTPKQLHVILMDSRRTEMSRDPKFKQALQCIRCASCLNVCPVFRLVGGHVFGKVYTGGIGTILTAWFDALKASDEIQSLCIQCGNCTQVCPGKIDIPGLILELRRRLAVEKGQPLAQKAIFSVVNNRRLFHSMLRNASLAQKPLKKDGFIRHLPFFLSDMTEFRSLPAIADVPLRDKFARIDQQIAPGRAKLRVKAAISGVPSTASQSTELQPPAERCDAGLKTRSTQPTEIPTTAIGANASSKCAAPTEKAAFYSGCLIDFAYPEMGESVVKILNKAGIEVTFPQGQTCCGAPARFSGAYEVAAQNAKDNIDALLSEDVQYVVSACPTCTVALKHDFIATFENLGDTGGLPRARELATKVIDFSTLVKKLVDEGRLTFKQGRQLGQVTYHDSCHLKRTLDVSEQPRELLTKAGYQIAEMYEADMCCGMGGSYSMKLPEISAPILQRKLKNIKDTGAPLVVMDCPGCVMQIRGGLDKDGAPIKVEHTAQRLAEELE
ncbi:MAG TPA: LUD domain-containing protein [Burkholderiales bacterium]|nr:LUD domain-containing protein [Burkholderiales bacterium]